MDAVNELREQYPDRIMRTAACTAISRENFQDLEQIIEMSQERGWLHAFTFVRTTEVWGLRAKEELSNFSPDDDYDGYLSVEEMHEALGLLHRHLWDRNSRSLYHATNRVALETIAYMSEHKKSKADCMSGVADLTILANGDVARCENLRPGTNLGDYDWDLKKLLKELFTVPTGRD